VKLRLTTYDENGRFSTIYAPIFRVGLRFCIHCADTPANYADDGLTDRKIASGLTHSTFPMTDGLYIGKGSARSFCLKALKVRKEYPIWRESLR